MKPNRTTCKRKHTRLGKSRAYTTKDHTEMNYELLFDPHNVALDRDLRGHDLTQLCHFVWGDTILIFRENDLGGGKALRISHLYFLFALCQFFTLSTHGISLCSWLKVGLGGKRLPLLLCVYVGVRFTGFCQICASVGTALGGNGARLPRFGAGSPCFG